MIRKIRNRKGDFTVKEGAEFLLAIVVIGLIVFFAVKIYAWSSANSEEEATRELLDSIQGKISNLVEGEAGGFPFRSLSGWHLLAFQKSFDSSTRPEKCFFNSCLCACPEASVVSCQEKGICRDLNYDYIFLGFKDGSNFLVLEEKESILGTSETGFSAVAFPSSQLFELKIYKNPSEATMRDGLGIWYPAPSLLSRLINLKLRNSEMIESITVFEGLFKKPSDFSRYSQSTYSGHFKSGESAFEHGLRGLLTKENNCLYAGWIYEDDAVNFISTSISGRRRSELTALGIEENNAAFLHGQYGSNAGYIAKYGNLEIFYMNPSDGTIKNIMDESNPNRIELRMELIFEKFDFKKIERFNLRNGEKLTYVDYYLGPCKDN